MSSHGVCQNRPVRRHGWSGDIPRDDEEAVARIIEATRTAIDQHGSVTVSEVAQTLGVTRPTVYRYFPTLDALLAATAMAHIDEHLAAISEHVASVTDPTTAVVESIAYTFERLPHDRYLSLLFGPGKGSAFASGMTSEVAMSLGRAIVERFDVDWAAAGFDDKMFDELIEVMLRVVQSLILDPGRPPRHGTDLRRFLSTWIAPAVSAQAPAEMGRSAPAR